MFPNELLLMDIPVLADHQKITFISYVRALGSIKETYQEIHGVATSW